MFFVSELLENERGGLHKDIYYVKNHGKNGIISAGFGSH